MYSVTSLSEPYSCIMFSLKHLFTVLYNHSNPVAFFACKIIFNQISSNYYLTFSNQMPDKYRSDVE